MRDLTLIRHGESSSADDGGLTLFGVRQMQDATMRFMQLWDKGSVMLYNSPVKRTQQSALIFSQLTGITSTECNLLSIAHDHDYAKHRLFAEMVAKTTSEHVVLIAHDGTRRVCEAIVELVFGRKDKPPYLSKGQILRFVPAFGYVLN